MGNVFDHFCAERTVSLVLNMDSETTEALEAICNETSHSKEEIIIALIWHAYEGEFHTV